jgi:hypothetical protein
MTKHESITAIPEELLIERLIEKQPWRSDIFNVSGIPDGAIPLRGVLLKEITSQKGQGDVDILLRDPEKPELAVAIEVKRIKVIPGLKGHPAKINKLHEFEKAVTQANRLAQLGFSQVYLYVFVVVDSRDANGEAHEGRAIYSNAFTQEIHRKLDEVISTRDLKPNVGLIRFELVQPMDHAALGVGTSAGAMVRSAQPRTQPAQLTKWVASLPDHR